MTTDTIPRRSGRPSTGQALDSTQRSQVRRTRARRDGGQVVTALLTPAATQALAQLRQRGATVDAAVCLALQQAAEALARGE
jgi:hypothetical protein